MRALILCDNHGSFPNALLERRPLCLMPIGTKPVLQHVLESLSRKGFKRITLAVSEQADYVQGYFGTGRRWGLEIDYLLPRGFDGIAEAVALAEPDVDEALLVVPALTVSDVEREALDAAQAPGGAPSVLAWGDGQADHCPEYLLLTGNHVAQLARQAISARAAVQPCGGAVSRPAGSAILVRDLPSYWEANRLLLTGQPPFGPAPARPGPRTRIHPRSSVQGPVILDDAVEIGAACMVGPMTVISSNCILDDGVEARECVILPGTFVGRNTSIVRAVADQGLLVGINDGNELHVPDPFILGPSSAVSLSGLLWDVAQRTLALAGLIAASPALAFMALVGLVRPVFWIKKTVVVSREISSLSGERRFVEATIRLADVRSGTFTQLPALWDVFRGRLALVGVEPLSPEEANVWVGGWAEPRFSCRAGLVCPWHVEGNETADEIERRVMEVFYAQTRSAGGDAALLWRAVKRIFSSWFNHPGR